MPGVDNAYTELALSLVGDWLTHVSEKAACFRLCRTDDIQTVWVWLGDPPICVFPGATITGIMPGNGLSLGMHGDMFNRVPRYM